MTFAGYMSAQTLFFEHEGQPVEPGTYYVIGDINDMMELQFELNVINGIGIFGNGIYYKPKISSLFDGAFRYRLGKYMCFTVCNVVSIY